MKKYLIGLFLTVFFCVSAIADDTTERPWMFSTTVEQGMNTQLKYGYFYATKPWTEKFSTTYGATATIDSATSENFIDFSSQTLTLNYSIGNGVSFYMLNDINVHGQRTETWIGTTFSWTK